MHAVNVRVHARDWQAKYETTMSLTMTAQVRSTAGVRRRTLGRAHNVFGVPQTELHALDLLHGRPRRFECVKHRHGE